MFKNINGNSVDILYYHKVIPVKKCIVSVAGFFLKHLLLLATISPTAGAQTKITDSLEAILKHKPADTVRIKILIHLFNEWEFADTVKAKNYASQLIKFGNQKQISQANAQGYTCLAYLADDVGQYSKALKNYKKALAVYKKINDKKGMASVMGGMGIIYRYLGNYPIALEYYFAALKISETLHSKKDMARHYGNIGVVYSDIDDSIKAMLFYKKAVGINMQLKNTRSIGIWQGNIAIIFMEQKKYDKAMHYYSLSYECAKQETDERAMAINMGNIGLVHSALKQYDSAVYYQEKALAINEKIDNKLFVTLDLTNLGSVYTQLGDFKKAEILLKKGLAVAIEINSKNDIKQAYGCLTNLYETTRQAKKALESYHLFCLYKDSLINEDRNRELTRHELTYEFEKRQEQLKAKQQRLNEQAKSQQERQFIILFLVVVAALAVTGIALVVWRSLGNAKKQNKIIELQKLEVEEKQREVIDSIRYSRRIQLALLKGEKYFEKNLTRLTTKNK
jgi:tetratricopeptide (TPR) repeat protein